MDLAVLSPVPQLYGLVLLFLMAHIKAFAHPVLVLQLLLYLPSFFSVRSDSLRSLKITIQPCLSVYCQLMSPSSSSFNSSASASSSSLHFRPLIRGNEKPFYSLGSTLKDAEHKRSVGPIFDAFVFLNRIMKLLW